MRDAQLKSARGYRKPRFKAGKPMIAAPNILEQRFNIDQADTAWVTDITYMVDEINDGDRNCSRCVIDGCLEEMS